MEWSWDAFGGVTQVIGLGYLYYQFNYLPKKEKEGSILRVQTIWMASKNKLQWLIDSMTTYAITHECLDQHFLHEATFQSQLMQLMHIRDSEFTDESYKQISTLADNTYIVPTVLENVNIQLAAFTELEAYYKTSFMYKNGFGDQES